MHLFAGLVKAAVFRFFDAVNLGIRSNINPGDTQPNLSRTHSGTQYHR